MRVEIERKFQQVRNSQQNSQFNLQSLLTNAKQGLPSKRMTREEQMQLHLQLSDQAQIKVFFSTFLRTLMDFQLRQHEAYLRTFTRLFRKVDSDNDGVLNEQEFTALIEKELGVLGIKDDTAYFLQVLDPFNTQRITFSELVQLFSAHMVSFSPSDDILRRGKDFDGEIIEDEDEDSASSITVPMLEKLNKVIPPLSVMN